MVYTLVSLGARVMLGKHKYALWVQSEGATSEADMHAANSDTPKLSGVHVYVRNGLASTKSDPPPGANVIVPLASLRIAATVSVGGDKVIVMEEAVVVAVLLDHGAEEGV